MAVMELRIIFFVFLAILSTFVSSKMVPHNLDVGEQEVFASGKLIFAHVLYRHGDRTPIKPYPSDPYRNLSFWPRDWGQLTETGREQQYELGRWLRHRYNSTLLSTSYSNDEIYVLSTNVNRTIMSAKANLDGMYEGTSHPDWSDVVNIENDANNDEKILTMNWPCPSYEAGLKLLKHSDEFKIVRKMYRSVFEYLSQNTGKAIKTIEHVQSLYSTLFIEDLHGFNLPTWTDRVYPEPLRQLAARSFATATYTRPLARLKAGPLLLDILTRFKLKSIANLKPNLSLVLFSAHDSTVANLLNTMDLFEWHSPPFCATILLEMRRLKHVDYISVWYKKGTNEPAQLLNIPQCGAACPLARMFELYGEVLPDNWTEECEANIVDALAESLSLEVVRDFSVDMLGFLIIVAALLFAYLMYTLLAPIWRRIGYHRMDGRRYHYNHDVDDHSSRLFR